MALDPRGRISAFCARTGAVLLMAMVMLSGLTAFAMRPARAVDTAAPVLSAGCADLNRSTYDVVSTGRFAGTWSYFAGERIILHAGAPAIGAPTGIQLQLSFVAAQSASFPGTITYVVPADGQLTVAWTAIGGDPTWAVSCAAPGEESMPAPEPTSTASDSNCVPRGNETAEQASQNGKDHSCGQYAKPAKTGKHGR